MGPVKRGLQPLPLSSSDRWIVDANGNHVPIVGINWPGAADTMLPEGLQYSSIECIVQKISDTGFNAVRLTFAIEMVDDILDNGGDVTLNDTLTTALVQTTHSLRQRRQDYRYITSFVFDSSKQTHLIFDDMWTN
jgi:hypothetical protein